MNQLPVSFSRRAASASSEARVPPAAGAGAAGADSLVVGENGPEYLKMGATGGTVIPNHALAGTTNYFITNQIKADPNGFVQSLKQYERINGTRWRR